MEAFKNQIVFSEEKIYTPAKSERTTNSETIFANITSANIAIFPCLITISAEYSIICKLTFYYSTSTHYFILTDHNILFSVTYLGQMIAFIIHETSRKLLVTPFHNTTNAMRNINTIFNLNRSSSKLVFL